MGPPSKAGKRWRPTPEQVMILKGLFRGGLTTPTSLQIQKITSQLIEYGKVESKNIFYWFQNHKAREKQKLITRKLHHHNNNNNIPFYFFYLPTQYPTAFSPISPTHHHHHQTMRDLTRFNITKEEDANKDKVNVTWLATDSNSSSNHHHHRKNRLKTLELFPTTSSSS